MLALPSPAARAPEAGGHTVGRVMAETGSALLVPFEITLMAVLASAQWLSGRRTRRDAPPSA